MICDCIFFKPKEVPGQATFRESIELGVYNGTRSEFEGIIDDLRSQFGGDSYNLMTKNCNHFAEALTARLLNKPFPGYVNRLANLGGMVSCLIPPAMLGEAPVGGQGASGASASSGGSYQVMAPRNRQIHHPGSSAQAITGGFSGKGMTLGAIVDSYEVYSTFYCCLRIASPVSVINIFRPVVCLYFYLSGGSNGSTASNTTTVPTDEQVC